MTPRSQKYAYYALRWTCQSHLWSNFRIEIVIIDSVICNSTTRYNTVMAFIFLIKSDKFTCKSFLYTEIKGIIHYQCQRKEKKRKLHICNLEDQIMTE